MTEKVWIGEFWNIDQYARMGLFDTQFKAFIACLKHYKKYKDYMMPIFKKSKLSNSKWHVYDIIKNLRRYDIYQEKIQ